MKKVIQRLLDAVVMFYYFLTIKRPNCPKCDRSTHYTLGGYVTAWKDFYFHCSLCHIAIPGKDPDKTKCIEFQRSIYH